MGNPHPPSKSLLFCGALFSKDVFYYKAFRLLEDKFGKTVLQSPPIKWDFSDYYKKELGEPIFRRFIFFERLIKQNAISSIKILTNKLEQNLAINGKRTVNLDPGYLTPAKIVLASTKDYAHRLYLNKGIFGEVTLIFKNNKFHQYINTYKDFTDERYLKIFKVAKDMLAILKS